MRPIRQSIRGLSWILLDNRFDIPTACQLFDRAEELTASGVGAFGIAPGLYSLLDDEKDRILAWLKVGLVAENAHLAGDAMSSIGLWLQALAAGAVSVEPPPSDLLMEASCSGCVSTEHLIASSIGGGTVMFTSELCEQQLAMLPHLLNGLSFLRNELKYHRSIELGEDFDVPLLRMHCVQLAQRMANKGWADEPAVALWLEEAANDPLPEVRNSLDELAS